MENTRNISKEVLGKVLNTMSPVIKKSLPDTPQNILPYITRLKVPNISPSIKPEIKKMMLDNLLSDEDYLATCYSIIATFFYNKHQVDEPTLHLILGQTGSGKSNLTAKILKENPNVIIIDSDKYKHYRPDAELIAMQNPTLYGFLTGPDAYGHRDNVYSFASNNHYNILIEIAPSLKGGLFNVDIPAIINKGYNIEVHTLAVSKLNSALSIHERYEGQIEAELSTPKLTDLNRHNESFEGLNETVKKLQNDKRLNIDIYRRAASPNQLPELVFPKKGTNKYSCPYHALIETQSIDSKKTEYEFEDRYNTLLQQMERRNAPQIQYRQLECIKEMYDNGARNIIK